VPPGYDFVGTVGGLQFGPNDPCVRLVGSRAAGESAGQGQGRAQFWWVARTPEGLGTLCLRRDGDDLLATAYGPGASWLLDRSDAVAGLRDDLSGFPAVASRHPVVARLAHGNAGPRLPATGRVYQRLLRAILEQKVTGTEAYRAYVSLVRHCHRTDGGEPAPGPTPGLVPPPDPATVAATPYWVLHRFGVEQRRADTLARASVEADRLERCTGAAQATRRLTGIQGIGEWTSAEVVRDVFGDPDAVSVGDYHIPHMVSWALAGEARAGARSAGPFARRGARSAADERMLELLEPFRGHRGRVCILLERGGQSAPRFGPRMTIRSFATF
jgi:3-methyladenine DNA glycosylase/8-oxoguanine DNA glycosylase